MTTQHDTPTMSDCSETDALYYPFGKDATAVHAVPLAQSYVFACQLERQRNALRAQLVGVIEQCAKAMRDTCEHCDHTGFVGDPADDIWCPYCGWQVDVIRSLSLEPAEPVSQPSRNVLKTVSSEWITTRNDNEVTCHSRMIEGVLCRWWGKDIPPGVHQIDAAASATPVAPSEDATGYIAKAYGYLFHVNNAPELPLYSKEQAAYKARHILRDLLTAEQRGEGITQAKLDIDAARGKQ